MSNLLSRSAELQDDIEHLLKRYEWEQKLLSRIEDAGSDASTVEQLKDTKEKTVAALDEIVKDPGEPLSETRGIAANLKSDGEESSFHGVTRCRTS